MSGQKRAFASPVLVMIPTSTVGQPAAGADRPRLGADFARLWVVAPRRAGCRKSSQEINLRSFQGRDPEPMNTDIAKGSPSCWPKRCTGVLAFQFAVLLAQDFASSSADMHALVRGSGQRPRAVPRIPAFSANSRYQGLEPARGRWAWPSSISAAAIALTSAPLSSLAASSVSSTATRALGPSATFIKSMVIASSSKA